MGVNQLFLMANQIYTTTVIQQVNSAVSYPDMLGLYLGLTRSVGEDNVTFLKRLYQASNAIKNSTVQGLIDTITFNLDLSINQAISITGPVGATIVLVPGILILNGTQIQLFTLAPDTYMEWMQLSEVVAAVNALSGWSATLLIPDTTAITLCKQTNINTALNEVVNTTDLVYTTNNAGLIESSLVFSFTPPSYSVSGDNITFATNPTSGLTISYQNIISPYNIISSDVNLIGLTEPNLIAAATNSSNVLGYQINEALQAIMAADASYWAN
jgi:hypothetical protein